MQQFIYRVNARRVEMLTEGPDETEAAVLEAHLEYLQRLADKGVVLLAGRTRGAAEATFGIVIFQAESAAQAATVMAGDPAVKNRVMDAQLFPYSIAVLSKSILAAGGWNDAEARSD